LSKLYVDNPEEFKKWAEAEKERFFSESRPESRERLRQIQQNVDDQLSLCKNPEERLFKMKVLIFISLKNLMTSYLGIPRLLCNTQKFEGKDLLKKKTLS
jgi:hypothetical protein